MNEQFNDDEVELLEHTIYIDEYLEARLKIPKQLTALDLKALMSKANKMFNLAEVPIVQKTTQPQTGTIGGRKEATRWTKEIRLDMARLKIDGYNAYEIVSYLRQKYGIYVTKQRVNSQIHSLKNRKGNEWSKLLNKARKMDSIKIDRQKSDYKKRGTVRKYISWKKEWVDDLMLLRNSGLSYRLVTKRLNEKHNLQLKMKQVGKKAWSVKNKSLWKHDSDIITRIRDEKNKEIEEKQTKQFDWQEQEKVKHKHIFTKEMDEEMKFFYKLGYTYIQIADKVNKKFNIDIITEQVKQRLMELRKPNKTETITTSKDSQSLPDTQPKQKKKKKYKKRRTQEETEEIYKDAYRLHNQEGKALTTALKDVFGYKIGSGIQKKFRKWLRDNNLPFKILSNAEVLEKARVKAREKNIKKKKINWKNKYTSHLIDQYDFGRKSREITDYLNERFDLSLSHKQVIDKIYLLKKQGVIKNG